MPEIEPLVLEGELVEAWIDYGGAWLELDGITLAQRLAPFCVRSLSRAELKARGMGDGADTYGRVRITVERLSDE